MVPTSLKPQLETAANTAISSALTKSAYPFVSAPTTEPGYIAAIIVFGITDVANAWNTILSPLGYSIQMSGVFCHQSPKVEFSGTGTVSGCSTGIHNCELADLLIVHEDISAGGTASRRAVLIQAKTTKSGRVSTPDPVQFDLYKNWPNFEIVSPKTFAAGPRDFHVTPGSAQSAWPGCQYGLIKTTPSGSPNWFMTNPVAPMNTSSCSQLGSVMADMISSSPASGRSYVKGGTTDWDKTIDELMNVTYHRAFTYRRVLGPGNRHPAGVTKIAFQTVTGEVTNFYPIKPDIFHFEHSAVDGQIALKGWLLSNGEDDVYIRTMGRETLAGGDAEPPDAFEDLDDPGAGVSVIHIKTTQLGDGEQE